MKHRRLTRIACALALACSFSASAAPLFDRVQGSLSGDASRTATVDLSQTTLREAAAGSDLPDREQGQQRQGLQKPVADGDHVSPLLPRCR